MSVKGNLRLVVEDSHLKASLLFQADPKGHAWDAATIRKLLAKKGIVKGVDEEALSEAVERFAESQGSLVKYTIARGRAPTPAPVPEYRWNIRPVPEDLSKDGEWVLRKAGDPHITRKKSRRVKVEKEIKSKGRFPLGRQNTKTVDSWVTEEWEEPIKVDPAVEEEGWAEKGDTLAEIVTPEGHQKLGETIFGKPVAVPETEAPRVHAGQGVEITGTSVVALHDGFVRRGREWVEVLPFQHHRWSVSASDDRATCLLSFNPGKKDASAPDPEKVLETAEEQGFDRAELLSAEKIRQLLLNAIHQQTPLEGYPITGNRDGWFKVESSEDRLKGLLSVRKGSGKGKPLVLKEIGAAIKKSGFKGLDFDKIKADLLEFYRSGQIEMNGYVLAEGEPPTRGEDKSFEYLCTFLKEDELKELRGLPLPEGADTDAIESLETYPLSSVGKMAFVEVGFVIAEIIAGENGEEGKDVYGNTLPGLPGNDPPLQLKENLLSKDNEIIANENGILDVIEDEGETLLRVRPYREASIEVEVSADRMEAYLSLKPPHGFAPPLTREKIDAALEEKQVVKGIDEEALSEALLKAKGGETVERQKIAEGSHPSRTESEGSIKFHVSMASGDKVTIKADGRADFRAHDEITTVEKDQLIAEIPSFQSVETEGWDVTGAPLSARAVEQAELNIGDHIRREEDEDGTVRLYADESGELLYDGRNMSVHLSHAVKGNVDMHTGNVRFPGDVQVKGNVERGFFVVAGGEVHIAGTVDGALVSSGGTIQIDQGVIGAKKAVLRAKENIKAQFVEEATILAVGDIAIKNSCLRSQVKCNGTLRLVGEKGTLIGGKVYAKHGLEVRNLGNSKGVRTAVSFGQDYLIADQIEQHEKDIQRLKELITAIDSQMKTYEQRRQFKSLEKVRSNKLKYLKMMEKRSLRLFTLREQYEEHFSSKVEVRDTLYPGVLIESHGRFYEVQAPQQNVTLHFNQDNGRIEVAENKKEE